MVAPLRAPTLAETVWRESLAGRELVRLPMRAAALRRSPRGDGSPVLLLPGLGATDASLAPLRRFLDRLGHETHVLGAGRMTGDVGGTVGRVLERLGRLGADRRPVALVGQSIGGVVAREVGREAPTLLRRIVTFGSPAVGGPEYTATRSRFAPDELRSIRETVAARRRIPIHVPITAIWSRNDGIVAPAACIDPDQPDVEHVEVTSSHLGMGFDPDVWAVVADRLAASRA